VNVREEGTRNYIGRISGTGKVGKRVKTDVHNQPCSSSFLDPSSFLSPCLHLSVTPKPEGIVRPVDLHSRRNFRGYAGRRDLAPPAVEVEPSRCSGVPNPSSRKKALQTSEYISIKPNISHARGKIETDRKNVTRHLSQAWLMACRSVCHNAAQK